MECKFACTYDILPVLETKLKDMWCKIEFSGPAKRAGTVKSVFGEFNYSHIKGMLFITTDNENDSISLRSAIKYIQDFIKDYSTGVSC